MTDPTNPLDWLTRLLIFFTSLAITVFLPQSAPSRTIDIPDPVLSVQPVMGGTPHVITEVNVRVMESFPMQIVLEVTGYQPDGCDAEVKVDQQREGNTVRVSIYRVLPPDLMCTMQIVEYAIDIPLEGGFEPGSYIFDVNGFIVELDL
jgi:inhibitor of cysteine peptidase